ncbi:hypothetical protein ABPG74_008493 [Tetrahymena malaccensis]
MKQLNKTSKFEKYNDEHSYLNNQYDNKNNNNSQIIFLNQKSNSQSQELALQNANQINNTCFLRINLDTFYYQIENSEILKYMFYPNLKSVEINLNQNSSRQINFKYLSKIFSRFQDLQKISVIISRDGYMNLNSFQELSDILKQNKQIKIFSLNVEQQNIENLQQLSILCSTFESFSELEKLKFIIKSQRNVIDKQAIQVIQNSLQKLKNLRSISLYLSSSIDNLNFNLELSKLISSLIQIKKIDLIIDFDNKKQLVSHEGLVSIFRSFSLLKNLQHLRFSMKKIYVNPSILEESFNLLPPIQKFTFYIKYCSSSVENKLLQQSCLKQLFPCFKKKIKPQQINIFKSFNKIENLSFCLHDVNDESLVALGLGFKSLKTVKHLAIFINPQCQIFKKEFQSESSKLLYNFYENYIIQERIDSEQGICCFAQGLSFLSQLKSLRLEIEQIKVKKQGLDAIQQCFQNLTNLNSLYIKLGSDFSKESNFLTLLMKGVKNVNNLKILQLELEYFVFSTQNTEGLASAFENMSNLENISLSFQKQFYYIDQDNQVSCLADIFRNLQNLTSIKLRIQYPQSARIISQQLVKYIKNVKIIQFDILDTMSSKSDIQTFIQNIIQNQQVQYLFYNLQPSIEHQQIFQKCIQREFQKKLKFLKRLVQYSCKK